MEGIAPPGLHVQWKTCCCVSTFLYFYPFLDYRLYLHIPAHTFIHPCETQQAGEEFGEKKEEKREWPQLGLSPQSVCVYLRDVRLFTTMRRYEV